MSVGVTTLMTVLKEDSMVNTLPTGHHENVDTFIKLSPIKIVPTRNYNYTTKTKMFTDEFNFIRKSSSDFFKKILKKKVKISVENTENPPVDLRRVVQTRRHIEKIIVRSRKNLAAASLTNREKEVFFDWFSARMIKYNNSKYGYTTEIPILNVVDDFMEAKVFLARCEAAKFLEMVDRNGNGYTSSFEFVRVFSDIESPEHVAVIRKFVKFLETNKFYTEDLNDDESIQEKDFAEMLMKSSSYDCAQQLSMKKKDKRRRHVSM
mmetsp:Transcript_28856/g.53658  ORF Transcript_28856/g.53658 Transcript_28856/m.53658 type:complete len:264 (-) Transcript_28856:244-1035(-)